MTNSAKLKLPYMDAAQAQKHVTLNESLRGLDVVVQLSVLDRNLATPPASPVDGDRYIVAPAATGAWAGQDGNVAAWQDNAWAFHTPQEGWRCWVADEQVLLIYKAGAWTTLSSGGGGASALTDLTDTPAAYTAAANKWLAVNATETAIEFTNQVPLAGVNATPDATNRLAVASPATLLNHEGAGHQLKVNKATATDTASLLFQDAFTGYAEFGLMGDDQFRLKVSPDGTTWLTSMIADTSTALVTVAGDPTTALGIATKQYVDANSGGGGGGGVAPNLLINGDFQINQRNFAGGSLAANTYGFDRWKAGATGANISIGSYTLTITSGEIIQVVEPAMAGVASLASTALTISVESPSANLTITIGSVSGTITAGTGRQSTTITTNAADTGNLTVKISSTTAGVTFGQVKLELGTSATGWQARPPAQELSLCQRYFQLAPKWFGHWWTTSATKMSGSGPFIAQMRATPTATLISGAGGVVQPGVSFYDAVSIASTGLGPDGGYIDLNTSGGAANTPGFFTANLVIHLSAEL